MSATTLVQPSLLSTQRAWWPMWAGLAVMLGIVSYDLGSQLWQHGQSDYGPLVLIIALWVLYQERHAILGHQGHGQPLAATLLLLLGLAMYVIGAALQILFLEGSAWIVLLAACLLAQGGWRAIRAATLVWLLLALFVPHPAFIVDALTTDLKSYVSVITEATLHTLGYPIGRNGVMLSIGPYQLLVADACSGMRSIFSLITIGLLYLYLMRPPQRWRQAAIVAAIIPVAVLANALRVMALVLITYHFGNDAGQGFTHTFAHVLLFLAAVALLAALDRLLGWLAQARANTPAASAG